MEMLDSPSREMNSTKEQCGLYNYIITDAQKEIICRHFGKNHKKLEDWEIAELLDRIIDNLSE